MSAAATAWAIALRRAMGVSGGRGREGSAPGEGGGDDTGVDGDLERGAGGMGMASAIGMIGFESGGPGGRGTAVSVVGAGGRGVA